jgi:N-acetylglucosaminyl-diphospho-decaprenol L-rhamnosyltransferase
MNRTPPFGGDDLEPLVTVSIVSHGDSRKIVRLLESLCAYEQTSSKQIIVTDNLGNELPEFDHSPWFSLHILRNERPCGFSRNHNRAFQLAVGSYFCVLNPDVVFKEAVFTQLLQRLKTLQVDIVAPLIVDSRGIIQDSFRDIPTPLEILLRRLPGYKFNYSIAESTELIQPDWISGIFLLMRSDIYRELDGLNDTYRLYFEDVEFCTRARLAGLKLAVDTNVRVQHDAHRASRKKLTYLLWHIQSAIRFYISPIYRKGLKISK